jgi:hypothetical protein
MATVMGGRKESLLLLGIRCSLTSRGLLIGGGSSRNIWEIEVEWVNPVSGVDEAVVERGKRHGSPYTLRAGGHPGGIGGNEVR